MNITIKQASIVSGMFLSYKYDEIVGKTKNNTSKSSDAPIHDDLRDAFEALVPHFAFISEEIDESQCRSRLDDLKTELPEEHPLNNFRVQGFTLGKNSEGVTISGTKRLKSGESIPFNTPFRKFDDDKDYPFMEELVAAIDELKSEVYEYLEGKQAPVKQMDMQFQDDDPTI